MESLSYVTVDLLRNCYDKHGYFAAEN